MLEKTLKDKKSHIFEINIDKTSEEIKNINDNAHIIRVSHELLFSMTNSDIYLVRSQYNHMFNTDEEKENYLKDNNQDIIVDKRDFKTLNSTLNLVIDSIFKMKGYSKSEIGDVKKITRMKIYYYAAAFIKEGYEDTNTYESLSKSCSEIYSSLENDESKKIVQEFVPKEFLEYIKK